MTRVPLSSYRLSAMGCASPLCGIFTSSSTARCNSRDSVTLAAGLAGEPPDAIVSRSKRSIRSNHKLHLLRPQLVRCQRWLLPTRASDAANLWVMFLVCFYCGPPLPTSSTAQRRLVLRKCPVDDLLMLIPVPENPGQSSSAGLIHRHGAGNAGRMF